MLVWKFCGDYDYDDYDDYDNNQCFLTYISVFTCVQVCNSLGQCHCDVGFGPPDCSQAGGGGSYHSNPASLYTTGLITGRLGK